MIEYKKSDVQDELMSVRSKIDGNRLEQKVATEYMDFLNWALQRKTLHHLKVQERQLYEYEFALLDILINGKA
ncbi:MAG: hypothetical protein HRT88_04090 [Lentisphaeraceae bacterium]|nr:hypothetical protein [Lentisphaeraceae bacterium]